MKKNIRQRILALLLALCLFIGLMPGAARAADVAASGTCGENLTWELDSNGLLAISGSGEMDDYSYSDLAPWTDHSKAIATAVVGKDVTSIGKRAFAGCTALTEITVGNSVTSIGSEAFAYCTSLTTVTMGSSVTSIGMLAFDNCSKLTAITLPEGVTTIEYGTFYECASLTSIIIPESVTSIKDSAFYDCTGLTSVTMGSGVVDIGEAAFFGCSSLTDITIPKGVTFLKSSTFSGCSALPNITIPEGVTGFEGHVFAYCSSLTSITIPKSVVSIGGSVFLGCTGVETITFAGNAPVIGGHAFSQVVATAYYLENDPTWTEDVMQDYGGTITWVPYNPNPFTDVPADKYYHDPVLWAYSNGITTGTTATTFAPNKDCTRGQIVTFLWRAAGMPEPTLTENPFTDVEADDFYYKAVLWAVEEGITTGATATTFNPKEDCNRAQVVTFMYRAAGSPAITGTDNPFEDVPSDKYYHDAVLWAVENGITTGASATKFAPNNTCTRGQIVTFLYRGYGQ